MKWHKQEKPYSCGPSALRNCLLFLEIERSESYLRSLMSTTKEGTSEVGITRGLDHLGLDYVITETKSFKVFRKKLIEYLKAGCPCILLVETSNHWIAAVRYKERKIELLDSEYKTTSKYEKFSNLKQLAFNWDKFSNKGFYYFIALV